MHTQTDRHDNTPEPIEYRGEAVGFFKVAIVNLFLTVVTIGIYRFWGKTRVRRYLWAQTYFQGESLEYSGKGIEKLVGALIAFGVLIVPLTLAALLAASLGANNPAIAALIYGPLYVGLFWLLGVAIYRSQRYLLSRTSWRGIRGGMRGKGWSYGMLYLQMLLLQVITLGFASPYTSVRLWNARMNDAMFGSLAVTSDAEWRPLFRTFLGAWVGALLTYAAMLGLTFSLLPDIFSAALPGGKPPGDPTTMAGTILKLYGLFLVGGLVIAMLMLRYYAAMLRALFGGIRIGPMALQFNVEPVDLLKFYIGNIALIVFTLGLGVIMMPYRVWSFYCRRLATIGGFDVDHLLQTDLDAPVQGDGLADAFDISAF